jgi:hypothetical protein
MSKKRVTEFEKKKIFAYNSIKKPKSVVLSLYLYIIYTLRRTSDFLRVARFFKLSLGVTSQNCFEMKIITKGCSTNDVTQFLTPRPSIVTLFSDNVLLQS